MLLVATTTVLRNFFEGEFFRESPVCTAKWKFWWENFHGAAKTKAHLPNTCYAIFDRLSLFREQRHHECELYFGIHDSFQFEPSLQQCSELVVRPRSCLPVSLVAGSMALLAAALLEAGTCIDSEPSGSGSADSTRRKYLYSAIIQGRFCTCTCAQ